ncbi:hypothetical protein GKIL_1596 [Gloeobacter kilaueensis JS1]|uniref:MalT-like TPR region domain-containing protein n=1 Tax=Gloeobacter kilaueensis (strain ATCC BAA-2537 / CCAP 1431/1 / ULC 316 / JS1) TaxID=1183438 RepID=U5QFX2_GLOK1|nr:hypothetical protein GKIL_1596 [Gloeobacter kilaueensis JS1]
MEASNLTRLWNAVQQEPGDPSRLRALAENLEHTQLPEPGLTILQQLSFALWQSSWDWEALYLRYTPAVEHLLELTISLGGRNPDTSAPSVSVHLEQLERARELAWRFNLPAREIHCLLECASLLRQLNRSNQAVLYCRRALLLSTELESGFSRSHLRGRAFTLLAMLLQTSDLEKALENLRLGIGAFLEIESTQNAIVCWELLAQLHEANGDLQSAIYAQARAIELLELTDRDEELLKHVLRQVNLLLEVSAVRKAKSLCMVGIELAEQLSDDRESGIGYLLLGNIYYRDQQWELAEQQYQQASECFQRSAAFSLLRHALLSLFESSRQRSNWSSAVEALVAAIRLAYTIGQRLEQTDIMMVSVLWAEIHGNGASSGQIEKWHLQLLQLAQELQSPELIDILTLA